MKRSFMRSRTTAIYDCWPDPLSGARSVSREATPDRRQHRNKAPFAKGPVHHADYSM